MAMYMQTVYTSQGDMNTVSQPSTPWGMMQDPCQGPCSTPPTMSPIMSPTLSPMAPMAPMSFASASPMGSCAGAAQWEQPGAQTPQPATEESATQPAAPTTVLLKGLPNGMCAKSAYMEVVLEEAGLDGCYVEIKVTQGDPCGRAVIKFSSWTAAAHCIRHFSGCIWDEAGMPVSACFAKTKTSASKREPTGSSAGSSQKVASATPPPIVNSPKSSVAVEKAPPTPSRAEPSPGKSGRPAPAKRVAHEDSDGSATSTRGSTSSAKSMSSPSLSPHSRQCWADMSTDDEDEEE